MPEAVKKNDDLKGNRTVAQKAARTEAEKRVLKTDKPRPSENTKSNADVLKIFKQLIKGTSFNSDHSDDLNALAFLLYHKAINEMELNSIVTEAKENNIRGITRTDEYLIAWNLYDKQIKQMTALRNSLSLTDTGQMKKVVELSKILAEENRAQSEAQPQLPENVSKLALVQNKQRNKVNL